jgi:hypothetical protein
MPRRRSPKTTHLRLEVAHEAARIMREQGIKDYMLAKRKAAERVGVSNRSGLPGNEEVEAALKEQQRIFGGPEYENRLAMLRSTAGRAMRIFEDFEPRLVGSQRRQSARLLGCSRGDCFPPDGARNPLPGRGTEGPLPCGQDGLHAGVSICCRRRNRGSGHIPLLKDKTGAMLPCRRQADAPREPG